MFESYFGKRVFVTGHTGFKGSWLCEMLLAAGAKVYGYSLEPPTKPSLFGQLGLARRIASHEIGDVRDLAHLSSALRKARPDFVFHLAAQPLVRLSYREPAETFETNVMGTVNVLEAVRRFVAGRHALKSVSVVCVTTDKVYENDNAGRAFVELDPLGGCDPYSASKGACEIAIASYRRSFFADAASSVRVASARAGNVIGGGDWAADRIVPDAMRAFLAGSTLVVRNTKSTRPWQHVLEPLSGYLMLGDWLARRDVATTDTALSPHALAFNFGPDEKTVKTVGALVGELKKSFVNPQVEDLADPQAPREAKLLRLDSAKAGVVLGWMPRWNFRETVRATANWYVAVAAGADPVRITQEQIADFFTVENNRHT